MHTIALSQELITTTQEVLKNAKSHDEIIKTLRLKLPNSRVFIYEDKILSVSFRIKGEVYYKDTTIEYATYLRYFIYAPVQVSNGQFAPDELPLMHNVATQGQALGLSQACSEQAEKVPINWIKADVLSGVKQLVTHEQVPRYILDAHTSAAYIT